MGAGLDKELIPPTVQSLERPRAIRIIDEYTAICAKVESDAEGLEPLLAGGILQL